MKKHFAALAIAAALFTQVGVGAFADDAASSSSGPMTSSGNAAWQVASFPFRLITGVSTGTVGAVAGGVKGIVKAEEKFAANTFGKMDENPILFVPGLIGTVAAFPVGFVMGAPEGAVKGAKGGYQWWDNF